MKDNKLTDNEIVKALEFLSKYCKDEYNDIRVDEVLLGALDLINRQKAEIERLEKIRQEQGERIADLRGVKYEQIEVIYNLKQELITAKAEAYKEFAERSKEKAYTYSDITGYQSIVVDVNEIDGVYEELVGD